MELVYHGIGISWNWYIMELVYHVTIIVQLNLKYKMIKTYMKYYNKQYNIILYIILYYI